MEFSKSLSEWVKDKPFSILQLDAPDRAVLKIADERDAIQKKTFTKWLNKHLKKHWRYVETYFHVCYCCGSCSPPTNSHVADLFEDLRDGLNLISLLEVLSGELLPRERGRMRFHQLQNVQTALDFLQKNNIKLVNIRPEDIVDGNPKLTLGLIWTIILQFQISDIIPGGADGSVREALLKWAQRTTERYPNVKVVNFTDSWRDGLAFCAILHQNRPELLDFKTLRSRNARENLELAFALAEKEFGVTRLLDPEDVDTSAPDERSLIIYLSSIYDVFPDPPLHHDFSDEEKRRKISEYKNLARNLHSWMQETLVHLETSHISKSLIDLKSILLETSRFRSDELPRRSRDKVKIGQLYKEIQKHYDFTESKTDLTIEEIEKKWTELSSGLSKRDRNVQDEIIRLEKLQRLTEKFHKDLRLCDSKLDDIQMKMKEEAKGNSRLILGDGKLICDQITNELKSANDMLKALKKDSVLFEEKKFPLTDELKSRLESLTLRNENLEKRFHSNLDLPLEDATQKSTHNEKLLKKSLPKVEYKNQSFCLQEFFDWVENKRRKINSLEFGEDQPTIKENLEQCKLEHKTVEQYNSKMITYVNQKNIKELEDKNYLEDIEKLKDEFKELMTLTLKRKEDLESLLSFVQSASRELKWLSDKEHVEIHRDWSAKNINFVELEHYQESITTDLEKREKQFNAIQSRGENLLLKKHPARKIIEMYLFNMQAKWSWILQLTCCLGIHLKHVQAYHKFFKDARDCDTLLKKYDEKLRSTFNKSVSSSEENKRLLCEIHELNQSLKTNIDTIKKLSDFCSEVVCLKQRNVKHAQNLPLLAICDFQSCDISLCKDDKCILKDSSSKTHWKVVLPNGKEGSIPNICFIIPPPNSEAVALAHRYIMVTLS